MSDDICLQLATLQKARRFCIASQSRCDRSMQSAIASALGFKTDATEAERKAVYKQAAAIMAAVENGKPFAPPFPRGDQRQRTLDTFVPLIPLSAQSREIWDDKREQIEKEMRALAKRLPVWPWVQENAKGVGELGLARLVGEATSGDISIGSYATHERLWKRFGVAVIGEERQQRKTDEVLAELHGFKPSRRAELWSVCSDTMIRAQWRGGSKDPESNGGYPIGPYGAVYAARKAHTTPRIAATEDLAWESREKWTKKRCDRDARRVMSKEFLRDLWRVWRGLEPRHPARWAEMQEAA